MCDPCQRVGPDPRSRLPADLYDQAPIRAMLATYDFGPFLLTVRRLGNWSQQTLGGLIGLEQSTISSIERGEHQLRNIADIAPLARVLQIPPVRLNFPDISATVGATGIAGRKDVSWVDRRDFGQHTAALILGIASAAHLDAYRILALFPQAEPTGTRHVGVADIEVIEQLTDAFRHQERALGSGPIRDAVAAQLRAALPLLHAKVDPELRPRLMLALTYLALQAAWVSFDQREHDAARRLWMMGLNIVRATDHPHATDLTIHLVVDMAQQAEHLGRPTETLHLLRIGYSAAEGRRHPVSPAETLCLDATRAAALAAQGDAAASDRALGQAQEHFTALGPRAATPWTENINEAFLAARQGHTQYTLALPDRDARAASRAVPLLRHAVDLYGTGYAKSKALYLPELAGAHAIAGDTDTAVTVGHQAVDAVLAVSSPWTHDRLRTLNTVLHPLRTSPGVAELRDRLNTIAA